jgi:ubiquitin-conjugating enzyme E2 S
MLTRIFHPNISKAGEICVDTLKKGWKKEYGVGHVLVTIKCLLIYPNPESALDEEAGKQLLADYDGYCKYAKLMTGIHATPKVPPAPFRGVSSASASAELLPTPPPAESPAATPPPSSHTPYARGPLTNARQETSPAPMSASTTAETLLKGTIKPVSSSSTTKAPTKTATKAGGAKRGLKRL